MKIDQVGEVGGVLTEANAGAPCHAGQGTWQGRLRVPAVRCGVSIACVAQEGEGAPPEEGGRHTALSVPGRGSLATGRLLRRRRLWRRWHPWRRLDSLRLLHPLSGLSGLAARALLPLQPSSV